MSVLDAVVPGQKRSASSTRRERIARPRTVGGTRPTAAGVDRAGPLEEPFDRSRTTKYPTLGFGKRDPSSQPGLLVPNPFFVSPAWWADLGAEAKATAAARPWGHRVDKVLFRGNCGPGAAARLELMSLRGLDDALDVGFTGVDGYASLADCVEDLGGRH